MSINICFLQPFNRGYVLKFPFNMGGVYEAPDTLKENSWAVKIDFQIGMFLSLDNFSDTAVGSVFKGNVLYEALKVSTSKMRISHKEWLAFEMTVRPVLRELKDKVVTWHIDNMKVRQAWLNSGSAWDT